MSKTKFLERFDSVGLNLPTHAWDSAIDYDIGKEKFEVFSSPRIHKKEHLDIGINTYHTGARAAVARNLHATTEHLNLAINDDHSSVRVAAAKNPNITKDQLYSLLTNRVYDAPVVAALSNIRYKEFFPNGH